MVWGFLCWKGWLTEKLAGVQQAVRVSGSAEDRGSELAGALPGSGGSGPRVVAFLSKKR